MNYVNITIRQRHGFIIKQFLHLPLQTIANYVSFDVIKKILYQNNKTSNVNVPYCPIKNS